MTATIQKWGNSLALRIPLAVAKQIHVKEGDPVTFAEPAPKDREVPGEGNKEAAAVLLEKPKTEDAAAALESGEFGEPFGASATKEGDTSPA